MRDQAAVLLSGGLDSATVLAIAAHRGYMCHCLTVNYGQRHRAELDAAKKVASQLGAATHRRIDVDLRSIGGSALTDDIDVPKDRDPTGEDVPPTYVPARNTILLALLLGLAEVVGANDLFIGANEVDYSGYPDCRPAFLRSFENLANTATVAATRDGRKFQVHAPLLTKSKAEIITWGTSLGVDYSMTVSCYDPSATGAACGRCDACQFRRQGFVAAGIPDPTVYI